ncbi:MAG: hypothetical protein L0215_10120 [Gemmataceae bacterium]|nr:hypothetical protein [Gemmataceae bacterium]
MIDFKAACEAVLRDPRYLQNLDWGEPRSGHPEGTVRAHIKELERNLARLRSRLSEAEYWKLKLLIHTHDTFKSEARPGAAITSSRSHASLARAFLAEYCPDPDLLAMVQYHDEPFALWRQVQDKGQCNAKRLEALLDNIRDWNLFLAFNIIDGCTEGKSRDPLLWFFRELEGKVASDFSALDIL